jgi:hypothetical protein
MFKCLFCLSILCSILNAMSPEMSNLSLENFFTGYNI